MEPHPGGRRRPSQEMTIPTESAPAPDPAAFFRAASCSFGSDRAISMAWAPKTVASFASIPQPLHSTLASRRPRHFHRRNQCFQGLAAPFPSRLPQQDKVLWPFSSLYVPQALSIKGLQRIERKKLAPRTTAPAHGPTLPCESPPHPTGSSLCTRRSAHCRPHPRCHARASGGPRPLNGFSFQTAGKGRVHPLFKPYMFFLCSRQGFARQKSPARNATPPHGRRSSETDPHSASLLVALLWAQDYCQTGTAWRSIRSVAFERPVQQ
jgi:hypothetical protein